MSVRVFYTSVTASREIRTNQDRIKDVLDSLKIPYALVDISQRSEDKDLMRNIAGKPTALPPQICNGDAYCGDFTAFEEAIEQESLNQFLKL